MEKPTDQKQTGLSPVLAFPSKEEKDNPLPSKRLTRETLVDFQEEQLVRHAGSVLPEMFRNVKRRLKEDDPKAVDQAMALYGYSKSAPTAVINNLTQNNVNTGPSNDRGMYFEKIVGLLERKDRPQVDSDIIDAEVVE